jgi:hypothetical protein
MSSVQQITVLPIIAKAKKFLQVSFLQKLIGIQLSCFCWTRNFIAALPEALHTTVHPVKCMSYVTSWSFKIRFNRSRFSKWGEKIPEISTLVNFSVVAT